MVNRGLKAPNGLSMKRNIIALIVSILLALLAAGVFIAIDGYTKSAKTRVELQKTYQELQLKQIELDKNKLDSKKNQKKIEELTKQLQAKKDVATAFAEAPKTITQPTVAVSGTCAEWMSAAGITDTYNATILLNKESNCNPNAVNRSSGACGLAQELPCGKSGCVLGDGACQMAWMNKYVLIRYGSWAAAVQFHIAHNWY